MRAIYLVFSIVFLGFVFSFSDLGAVESEKDRQARVNQLLQEEGLYTQAIEQMLKASDRMDSVTPNTEFGGADLVEVSLGRADQFVKGYSPIRIDGFKFKVPEVRGYAELTWYFEPPKGMVSWGIVRAKTGEARSLLTYNSIKAKAGPRILQRPPILDLSNPLKPVPNFVEGETYIVIFYMEESPAQEISVALSVIGDLTNSFEILSSGD